MKTITLTSPGHFTLDNTPEPSNIPSGYALVRVHKVGICGTDLHAYQGKQPFFTYPRILGHELGVEVLAVSDDIQSIAKGDRCAVEPYLDCGKCIACRQGKPNCCVNLRVIGVHIDGGMREQFILPANKLHKSSKLSYEQLALVEPLGIGAHAVARAQVKKGETVLVIGSGPIGLSVIQFAQAAGAVPIVMDINRDRLAFCQSQFGVKHVIDLSDAATAGRPDAILAQLNHLTDDDLPTAVFDATGNPKSMATSFNFPAHGGRLIFVGLFPGDITFNDPNFHRRELTLLSSRNAMAQDFGHIIGLMESSVVNTTPWITHRASADELIGQFGSWLDPANKVLKAMIEF